MARAHSVVSRPNVVDRSGAGTALKGGGTRTRRRALTSHRSRLTWWMRARAGALAAVPSSLPLPLLLLLLPVLLLLVPLLVKLPAAAVRGACE
jgi:hypothetical protein